MVHFEYHLGGARVLVAAFSRRSGLQRCRHWRSVECKSLTPQERRLLRGI
jgi:hypothetical protein